MAEEHPMADNFAEITGVQARDQLQTLKERFERNMARHPGLAWKSIEKNLAENTAALRTLHAMETTGGEPDAVDLRQASGAIAFVDCAAESPAGRRNLCYDRAAREGRKENRPAGSAVEMAAAMGVELLTEAQYRALQRLGTFDAKTSSWVVTPEPIRSLGGALFCDRRYDHVFTYHNGAASYYAARGFRGMLVVLP